MFSCFLGNGYLLVCGLQFVHQKVQKHYGIPVPTELILWGGGGMVVLAFSQHYKSTIRTKKSICVEFGPGSYVGFLLMVDKYIWQLGTCTWKNANF